MIRLLKMATAQIGLGLFSNDDLYGLNSNAVRPTGMMSVSLLGDSILGATQEAMNVSLGSKRDDGQIEGLTYWQVANGYTAIALHDTWSNISTNAATVDELLAKVETNITNCINEMNDDSMWWSICSLEMLELTNETNHLATAEAIWEHVNSFVIPHGKYIINGIDMEGGVIWSNKTDEVEVNAITTGLYSELSARLSSLQEDESSHDQLLSSAVNSLSWILRAVFNQDEYLVFDHINLNTSQITNWTFTYNTGQAIAASIAVYDAMQGRPLDFIHSQTANAYLDLACNMANHSMTRDSWVNENGTLTEVGAYPGTGEDKKKAYENNDAIGFKAVLLRNLAKLYKALLRDNCHPHVQQQLVDFIKHQYQILQDKDTIGKGQYGPWWDGPMDLPTSHSQLAALDAMAAIHAVGL
ncbi:hypothetical protein H2200_004616 [Cladophialophora chaetospira]|uniref:Uncharacterized protein n=1 Tax=Cladophialophora chaetospira TaxID=386627 RepID=A0AA39CJM6_9EURO|nr:hypothetical protein H2200_004616 [Cladophialophora chaetospira]